MEVAGKESGQRAGDLDAAARFGPQHGVTVAHQFASGQGEGIRLTFDLVCVFFDAPGIAA